MDAEILTHFAILIGALISVTLTIWFMTRVNAIADSLESAAKSLSQISESTIEIRHD